MSGQADTILSAQRLNPVMIALLGVGGFTLLGWSILFFEAAGRGVGSNALLETICRPAAILGPRDAGEILRGLAYSAALWVTMSVAMMLPTASAMVLSYADAAQVRRQAGARAGSPLLLIGGYLAVWAAVSVGAALLQSVASAGISTLPIPASAATVFAGAAVGAAGFYQVSTLKLSCLAACRQPELKQDHASAFRLGIAQGVQCLGCCGPMMAIMMVMGTMNLVWMAVFSLVMALEKLIGTPRAAQIIGVLLLVVGAGISLSAVAPADLLSFALTGR